MVIFRLLCYDWYYMPKLPDPTLGGSIDVGEVAVQHADQANEAKQAQFPVPPVPSVSPVTQAPAAPPASPASPAPSAKPAPRPVPADRVKKSPFRFVGPLLVLLFLAGIGFLVFKYLIQPRLAKSETVTLAYWGLWEPESVMAPAIAAFEQENPTIKVQYQMQSKVDYRERLQSALARNEGPDIMRLHATWLPMFSQDLAAAGDQYPLVEFTQTFYPGVVTDVVKGTSVMAVPLMTDGLALFTNDDLFVAANASVPTSWDDFRKTAFDLTKRDDRGNIVQSGAAIGTTNNITHWPDILAVLMLQNSVDLARPASAVDAKGRNLGADALKYYSMFSVQDRIWDETLPTDTIAFANGKVAMILAPSWDVFSLLQLNPALKFSVHPIPQLTSQRKVTWASYWVEGVSKRSKHQKEAWKFLKFLSSKEGLQLMYTEASKIRQFGEPYPRIDMASLLSSTQYVAPFVTQALDAKSWYMSSQTGDHGINDEIITYWADAVDTVTKGKASPETAIATAAKGVEQVLAKYGVR